MDMKDIFKKAYKGSYYTITGAGGDLEEWKKGYQELLDKENIGKVEEWITFKGKDMNEWAHLTGSNAYDEDLTFLMFPLEHLDVKKLPIFKIKLQDRWFDDIVDNNARREHYHPIEDTLEEGMPDELFYAIKVTANKMVNFLMKKGVKDMEISDAVQKPGFLYDNLYDLIKDKGLEKEFKASFLTEDIEEPEEVEEVEKSTDVVDDEEVVEDKEEEIPVESKDAEMISSLNSIITTLIKSEYDAIQEYKDAVSQLTAIKENIAGESEEITGVINILKDIADEEMAHVGELQSSLNHLLGEEQVDDQLEKGSDEAEEMLEPEEEPEEEIKEEAEEEVITEDADLDAIDKELAELEKELND